jgi:hypothetical protein
MARRRKNDNRERSSAKVTVQFAPSEREQVAAAARDRGFTVSAFLRHRALGLQLPPPGPSPQVIGELTAQIARVGNNVNQLTYYAHRDQHIGDIGAVLERLKQLDELMHQVMAALHP